MTFCAKIIILGFAALIFVIAGMELEDNPHHRERIGACLVAGVFFLLIGGFL